jgi:hypothetical protein
MDKKTSACVTGFLLCAMLYANVSITRADMRAYDADTFALAYVTARPALVIAPGSAASFGEATLKPAAVQAGPSARRHFDEYLQLHRSRIETRQAP